MRRAAELLADAVLAVVLGLALGVVLPPAPSSWPVASTR